jgi:glycosyltransferase involved in cell wall biosynthesis
MGAPVSAEAPISLLYLTPSGQVGGAERCLLSLAAGLDRGRFRPAALVGSEGPLTMMLTEAGVSTETVALPAGLRRLSRYHANRGWRARVLPWVEAPGYWRRLRQAGGRYEPRLIHSNGLKMHMWSAALARGWGARLLWHLHDFPPPGLALRLLRGGSGRCGLAVANSAAVARAYAERVPELGAKLRVVPNGVAAERMRDGDRQAFRERWGLGGGDFVIGMIAIFAPWKGQEVFLQAARQARAKAPGLRFLLVGDDVYDTAGHGGRRRELEALARELDLAEAVRFTGYCEQVVDAYAALDVLVHASTAPEPFGRTAIEAMAAGVPVIAAAAGGMVEVVEDGRSGRLTPPGDAGALAQAMLELHRNTELRRTLAAGGLRRVGECFSEAAVARQMAHCYEELLG